MSALKIAKCVVFLLSILLVIMAYLVIEKVTENTPKINKKNEAPSKNPIPVSDFILEKKEDIFQTFSCGDFVCITTRKDNNINKIRILTPNSGQIIREIRIKKD